MVFDQELRKICFIAAPFLNPYYTPLFRLTGSTNQLIIKYQKVFVVQPVVHKNLLCTDKVAVVSSCTVRVLAAF